MDFLRSLPPHALVADCGCGNGKYLGELPALETFGSDTSVRLLQLCRERCVSTTHLRASWEGCLTLQLYSTTLVPATRECVCVGGVLCSLRIDGAH